MKKLVLALVLVLSIAVTCIPVLAKGPSKAPTEITNFNDISKHWAKNEIEKRADPAIFAGKDGKFSPDQGITRGKFVLMLHKVLNIQIK